MPNTLRPTPTPNNPPHGHGETAAVCMASASMHRHHTLTPKTPSPVTDKTLVRPLDVIVAGVFAKRLIGQIGSAVEQRIGNVLVHSDMLQRGLDLFNSHFPIPFLFVHGATVCRDIANKNVRGATT